MRSDGAFTPPILRRQHGVCWMGKGRAMVVKTLAVVLAWNGAVFAIGFAAGWIARHLRRRKKGYLNSALRFARGPSIRVGEPRQPPQAEAVDIHRDSLIGGTTRTVPAQLPFVAHLTSSSVISPRPPRRWVR